jgi:UDP-2,3-diacylglucosamine pyrophosphatase LpxH
LAEHLGGYIRGFKDLIGYIDDAIDLAVGSDNIFEAIIEGLAERAHADQVILSEEENISVDKIKSLYRNLKYHDQPFKVGKMLANESDLEKFGDQLSEQHGHKIVVFGHTHVGKIDKDSLFTKERVYVNSGCWCGKEAYCVVVEPDESGKTAVSLLAIDSAGEITKDKSQKMQV